MTEFAQCLKPLVLATMMAGCMEFFVEACESIIVRIWRFIKCAMCCRCFPSFRGRSARQQYLELGGGAAEGLAPQEAGAEDGCLPPEATAPWRQGDAGQIFCARLLAVVLVLTATILGINAILTALVHSFHAVNLDIYRQGFTELEQKLLDFFQHASQSFKNEVQKKLDSLQEEASATLLQLGNDLLSGTTNLFVQTTMFLLYALMWLLAPLPSGEKVFVIVRTYFMYKSFTNMISSAAVFILLTWIGTEMAVVVSVLVFFLGFIPEVGFFIAIVLPVPLLLLDSRVPMDIRVENLATAAVGMLAIKFVVSNGLESVLMGKSQILAGALGEGNVDEETHPVIILFVVVLCGQIWGVTGMLISVPLISMIRLLVNFEKMQRSKSGEHMEELAQRSGAGAMA